MHCVGNAVRQPPMLNEFQLCGLAIMTHQHDADRSYAVTAGPISEGNGEGDPHDPESERYSTNFFRFSSVERLPKSWSSLRIPSGTFSQMMETFAPSATGQRLHVIFISPAKAGSSDANVTR